MLIRFLNASVLTFTRAVHSKPDIAVQYKSVLASHPSALAVITVSYGTETRAATVSSVTSVSVAEPGNPLLSFNLKLPSSTSRLIHLSGKFSVNLLSGSPGAQHIAAAFAGDDTDIKADAFPTSSPPFNTPMLNRTSAHSHDNAPIAFARLDCYTKHCFPVRDHEIWVGEVDRIYVNDRLGPGMVYFNRHFTRISHTHPTHDEKLKKRHLRHHKDI
ncbi:flavin reductase like domain-containing protein [Lipomyces arxii]|uniref:flavin reductase like domain-containing protein n=1 Tax=Lipomyces arxii TaxID=56418 RepID=UPI0034CE5E1D